MSLCKIIVHIILLGLALTIAYHVKKEIEKQHPELKDKVPKWIWRF